MTEPRAAGRHRLEDARAIGVVRASMVGLHVERYRHRAPVRAEAKVALWMLVGVAAATAALLRALWPLL